MKKELYDILKTSEPILMIANNSLKKEILRDLNFLKRVSFITLKDFISRVTFDYDEKAIYYVMKEFHLDYDVTLTYLSNMRLVFLMDNKEILNKYEKVKVKLINDIYKFLEENKYLIYNKLFIASLKNKKIVYIKNESILKEDLRLLEMNNVEIIDLAENQKNKINRTIFECKNIEEELHLVLEKICELLINKVNINQIKIAGINNDDYSIVKTMFDFYKIPINIPDFIPINQLNNIDIDNYEPEKYENNEITLKIVSLINSLDLPKDEIYKIILAKKLEKMYVENERYINAVEIIDINDTLFYKDDYVFIIGVNEGIIPHLYKDDDFFKDSIKLKYHFSTSSDKNISVRNIIKNIFETHQNLYLSYRLFGTSEELYPSSIIKELDMKVVNNNLLISNYSEKYNKVLLIRYLDLFVKYGIKNEYIKLLYSTFDISYLKYDNTYKKIDKDKFLTSINDKIDLSYTKVNSYYECEFKFYLDYILRLSKYEDTFPIFIGNLFHYVLSKAFLAEFNFDDTYLTYINNSKYELNAKEKFLLNRLKEELLFIIKVINEQLMLTTYDKAMYEKNINISSSLSFNGKNIKTNFTGIIDKLLYKEIKDEYGNITTYISVIDYKTSNNVRINIDLIDYGLSLQLPIYIYLLNKTSLLPNIKIGGVFIQNILNKSIKAKDETEYDKNKRDNYKLNGYLSRNNGDFDLTVENSSLIKGIRQKKDGDFYSYSKVLSTTDIEQIYDKVNEKINNAFVNILNCEFNINPKMINGNDISCIYCTYSDICYKSYKNYIKIKIDGDDDAKLD